MFCPECGGEYRAGFDQCTDCGVALVAEPVVEPRSHEEAAEDLVAVLQTPDLGMLAVIKSLLDSADIPYVVQGEEGVHQIPLGPVGGLGFFRARALGATIRVRQDDAEAARELIARQDTAWESPDSGSSDTGSSDS